MNQHKAVFFDRDNTLIVDHVYLNDPKKIDYLPFAVECLRAIQRDGYKIIIVTNQSGIPRGLVTIPNLRKIHSEIRAHFARNGVDIAGFYYAPFLPESNHPMRKPNPGMLLEAGSDHAIDFRQSWMVGDRLTDIQAGQAVQAKTVFLTGTEDPDFTSLSVPPPVAKDLLEVAEIIVGTGLSHS